MATPPPIPARSPLRPPPPTIECRSPSPTFNSEMDDKNLNPKPKVNSSAKTREYRAARDPLKLSFPYFPPNSFSLTSNPPIKKAAPTMDDKQAAVTALIQQLEQQKEELKVAGEKVATEIGTQLGLGTPKDLGKDFKKLKKKGYRCPSAETCSNVFCDHTRAVPWADDKKKKEDAGAAALERMIDLLMQKCEKDGYKISLMFATAFMAKHGSKIVPALKAIKNNIDSREKALLLAGRVSYDRELQFARGEATRRRDYKDQIIEFMELDDKQLKELGENGWMSSYGKGLKGQYGEPQRTRWFDTYVEEANFRAERAGYYKQLAKEVEVGTLKGGMEKMEKLLRTYDGLEEDCHCDKCGPAPPPAEGEVEKPKPPGVKGRGKMLIHLRCSIKDVNALTTTAVTTALIPDLDNGNSAEVAAHCAKVGLDEEALALDYGLLQVGNSPVDGSDLNIPEQVIDMEQPKKAKPQSDFGKLQIIEKVDEASSVEDSDNSDFLKNGLTKGGEAAIVQMVDRIVKSQTLVEVQNKLMDYMEQSEINKHKRASRNLLRMMGQASIEASGLSARDRWSLAGAAKRWGIENGIEEAQLDEVIGDPVTFGDDGALEESGDESSTDSDELEVENDEPQLEKTEPKVEKKVEVALPVDVEAETRKLHKRLTTIHEREVGFLEEGPFDAESIRHVKEMCGIEKDSWASSYLALGGGSAALAVRFYHAAHVEIQQHFDKLGLKDPSATKFYIEVMQFFLNLIGQHRRRIEQGGSRSNGHGARRGYRARRA